MATDSLDKYEDIYDDYMIDEHCNEAEETEWLIMDSTPKSISSVVSEKEKQQ